jgi:photosystem II stability/assembly factor-like uncharacterized protein
MKRKSSQELYCYILNQDGYTASNKLVRSLDGGQTWKVIFNSYLTDFGITNELLVLHSDKDLYVSSDKGDSWQKIQNNVDDGIRYGSFLYTADEAGNLYSAIGDKLYKWSSVNSPWQQVGTAPDNGSIGSIRLTRSGKIVITNGGGVYLSGDGGSSWKLIRRSNSLTFLEHSNTSDYLFVFTENDGLYASADEGKSWNLLFKASQTSPEGFTPAGILVDSRNRIWLSGKTNFGTKSVVYLSENGRSFRQITNPFLNNQTFMQPIEIAPGQIAIPTQSGGIFKIQPF